MGPEYRTTTTTGAKALRAILMDMSLKEQWSVAFYIPEAKSQFSKEDCETEAVESFRQRERFFAEMQDECVSDTESDNNWMDRCNYLTKQDMKHFFRAGFQQTKETVVDHVYFFVFAVPCFLEQRLMSHDEAMSVIIVENSPPWH